MSSTTQDSGREYVVPGQGWVRDQLAEIEATGDTGVVSVLDRPVVVVTMATKAGRYRKVPVMRVEHDGSYAVVASKGGAPEHPVWYHNFLAHPVVQLQDGPEPKLYRARLVEEQGEYDAWWQRAVEVYEPYAEYKPRAEAAGRTIPLFVLDPVG